LIDSNVLLDVFSASQPWLAWSQQQLDHAARRGPVFINDVIYAEISVQFAAFEVLDAALKKFSSRCYPCLVRHCFSLERHSGNTARRAGCEPVSYRTFLSGLTLQFSICRS
jgi:hypothetical protein